VKHHRILVAAIDAATGGLEEWKLDGDMKAKTSPGRVNYGEPDNMTARSPKVPAETEGGDGTTASVRNTNLKLQFYGTSGSSTLLIDTSGVDPREEVFETGQDHNSRLFVSFHYLVVLLLGGAFDILPDHRNVGEVMFGIFASITIKPEQRQRFLEVMTETAFHSVENEPGCMRFDVFQDESDENRYLLYEVYIDEKAFEEHLETPHARRAMEGSSEWSDSSFQVTRAKSIFPNNAASFETVVSSS
jgi:quinol monooxygenase YgiN